MLRCDQGNISKVDKLPSGYLRIKGTIAQVGWLRYLNQDGSQRLEYVDEDTLFNEEHLNSIGGAPLTLQHPKEPMNPSNYKQYNVGATGTHVYARKDLGTVEIITVVCDESAIKAVLSKDAVDLSMGYECETVHLQGNEYKQINRLCNHNALVAEGRANKARLHLDGYMDFETIATPIYPHQYLTKIIC